MMEWRQQLRAAAVVAVATLTLAPAAEAQGRACKVGRGIRVADLGFVPIPRSTRIGTGTGRIEVYLDARAGVQGVRADGPAAGRLVDGDLIVALDGIPIAAPEAATRYARLVPGERVRLSVRRAERAEEVVITAGEACAPLAPDAPPPAAAAAAPPAPLPPNDELLPRSWFGMELACDECGKSGVGAERRIRFRSPLVVVGVRPDTPAARAGIRAGDRITHLDGLALTSEEGSLRFADLAPGQRVVWTYVRDGRTESAETGA